MLTNFIDDKHASMSLSSAWSMTGPEIRHAAEAQQKHIAEGMEVAVEGDW